MAWRVIGVSNPAKLSVKNKQLLIQQEEKVSIPIEDLDALVIDSYGVQLTTNLISELSAANTTLLICDDKHLPTTVLLPYSQHSRQAKVSRAQLVMSLPLKKQLWQSIIAQKITNQAEVLRLLGFSHEPLIKMSQSIKSGDSTNRESQAARYYFATLLEDVTRRKPIWHNSALDYGYAIVRSHIARHIAARGLIASQGVFHHSELNAFNLADDLIEPYRPFVDYFVLGQLSVRHIGQGDMKLEKSERQALVDILNIYVIIDSKKYTMKHAIERTVESFIQALNSKSADRISLPKLD